jgi:serine/threonine protein kinase
LSTQRANYWSKSRSDEKFREKAILTLNNYVSNYFGITQDLYTQDFMIIMPYYGSGDLIRHISNSFYEIKWYNKLDNLKNIALGLTNIHSINIIHRDLHSGNIFFNEYQSPYIGDLYGVPFGSKVPKKHFFEFLNF